MGGQTPFIPRKNVAIAVDAPFASSLAQKKSVDLKECRLVFDMANIMYQPLVRESAAFRSLVMGRGQEQDLDRLVTVIHDWQRKFVSGNLDDFDVINVWEDVSGSTASYPQPQQGGNLAKKLDKVKAARKSSQTGRLKKALSLDGMKSIRRH